MIWPLLPQLFSIAKAQISSITKNISSRGNNIHMLQPYFTRGNNNFFVATVFLKYYHISLPWQNKHINATT